MQTDDPYHHLRPQTVLSPPFEYRPSVSSALPESRNDVVISPSLDSPLEDNPDDFYRPFAEPPPRPDIILQGEDSYLMATTKRRPAQTNGTTSKTTSPSSTRSSLRAASGPSSLAAAKSAPSLAASARSQNGSIKERIKQFDQAGTGSTTRSGATRRPRSRTPSTSRPNSSVTSSPVQEPTRYRRPHHKESPSSRAGSHSSPRQRTGQRNGPRRQPLFGEVVDSNPATPDAGYGISGITKPHTDSHGSTHQSNALFNRTRSHSDLSPTPELEPLQIPPLAEVPASVHQRSQSDLSPTSPTKHMLSPSKIPIRTRRNSDVGPSRSSSPLDAAGCASTNSSTSSSRAPSRSSRPGATTLNARRYSPKRSAEPTQSLNAVVRAPPPKTSPPLRSSRPRQPLTASTTASRAKVTDRFSKSGSSEGARSSHIQKKTRPVIPGGVDVAARRAKLQNKLQSGAGGDPSTGRHGVRNEVTRPITRTPKQRVPSGPILQPTVFQQKSAVPELAVSVDNTLHTSPRHDESNPATEVDESPILGHDTTYPTISQTYPSPPFHTEPVPTNETEDETQNNILTHVMSLRQSSASTTPKTRAVSDFLSERDDSETIQIILGATPMLPQSNWAGGDISPNTPFAGDLEHMPEDAAEFFDARSEIRPEDSVSMVFGQRPVLREERGLTSQYLMPRIPQGLTLDSEARSQINHVLDQYREGMVTPAMASGFQQAVEKISPLLPQHNAWTSREATEHYLQTVLESAESEISTPIEREAEVEPELPPTSFHPNFDEPSPEEFEGPTGTAIIYSQPERYRPTSTDSLEKHLNQHSHSTSNATLRPSNSDKMTNGDTYHQSLGPGPIVPPKEPFVHGDLASEQRPRRPDISTSGEGLGLSMDADRPATPVSPLPPARAPPPPPTPKDDFEAMATRALGPVAEGIFPPPRNPPNFFSSSGPSSPVGRVQTHHPPRDVRHHDGTQSGKASLEIPRENEGFRYGSLDGRPDGDARPTLSAGIQRDREKELNERKNTIKELVDTEHSYSQDMTIMEDIYMGTASSVLSDEDRKVLFGNLDQVRAFSVQFLDALRHACSTVYTIPRENRWNFKRGSYGTSCSIHTERSSSAGSGPSERERVALDEKSTIGQTFLTHVGQIENVYGNWIIKTNDAANKLLKELQQRPGVKLWLDECHASARDITQAWSLDALIIKPAQRLMKYPLLLQSLLKSTPRDHPDYEALRTAHEQLVLLIGRINASKKRSELVDQAMNPKQRKDSESKMRVGKLLNRRTEKLKQQVGLSAATDDQDYEAIAQKFGGHFFQLQIVMRDVEKYLEDMQTSIEWLQMFVRTLVQFSQLESQERWPEYESNWIRFCQAVQEVLEIALQDHIAQVRKCVIDPILTLWKLHVGPQKMMQKRKKRLVDHLRYKSAVQRGEKPDKKLQLEEDQYNAVNDTLKDELPKLYAATKKLVEACLKNFIDIQAEWQNILKRKFEPFIDNAQHLPRELSPYIAVLQSTFNQDAAEWEARVQSLGICNGSTLMEALNFLSPATTFTQEDASSTYKRPSTLSSGRRTLSISSEQASYSTPNSGRISDNFAVATAFSPSPLLGSFPIPDGISQNSNAVRTRASSAMSSRGPSTPRSMNAQPAPSNYYAGRPSTASERNHDVSAAVPRLDLDLASGHGFGHEGAFFPSEITHGPPDPGPSVSHATPDERFSGIFHSALPMSDSPRSSSPQLAEGEARVLFLAASLFEFNIDGSRREAGYPYLRYVPGEIFDVIGQKGELWLAKNQDDPSNLIGWIWEKHFARILPDEA